MNKLILPKLKNDSIFRLSLNIGLITLSTKLIGYVEKVILAFYLGTSYKVDVYNVIFTIVFTVFVFVRELIEPGFLNVFLKAINSNDEKSAWVLFNKVGRYIFYLTTLMSILVYLFPEKTIDFFAPGFHGLKRDLSIKLIKITFPACVFLSLTSLTNITLNGLKKFALPAFGDLVFKATMVVAFIFLFKYIDIYAAAVGIGIGAIFKLLIHSSVLFRNYSFGKLKLNKIYSNEALRLTWPLLLGVCFSQISTLIDNMFASYMQEGAISALSYSKKIIDLPILIFPYIISLVAFPYFSEFSITKEKIRMTKLLAQCLFWITVVILPVSIFFYLFSYEIIEIILKHGAFNANSTLLTANPFKIYSAGLLFFGIESILVVFYFANSNTAFPILIGVLCVIENITLTYILIQYFGYIGIALGFVISKITKGTILLAMLKNSVAINFKAVANIILKIFFSNLIFFLTIYLVKYITVNIFFIKNVFILFLAFLLGFSVYTISLLLSNIRQYLIKYL